MSEWEPGSPVTDHAAAEEQVAKSAPEQPVIEQPPQWRAPQPPGAPQQSLEVAPAGTSLRGAALLTAEEASGLLARGQGRVVVWMGERGAGKTAITARLYERQRLPNQDVQFAGSATLLAFEALAYRRRQVASGLLPPAERAEGDPRQIYHLALASDDDGVNLLIADLPGELFRALADNQIALSAIPLVRRADKLALIVDGARLRDGAARAAVLTRVRQLLERIAAASLPAAGASLAMVVTKWDLVAEDPETLAYWHAREHDLAASVRELDPHAPHIRVAAAAPASFPQDDGIGALRSWLVARAGATIDPPVERYEWPVDAPERIRLPWRRRK
jgi:hypothetical protein